ncbi:MAG: hypothetical protein UT43_C0011G0001 [Parcubacteria group bacterium GW2011_GWC1_39_29]|uniref:Uncharacterized protein n=1 Tax=Candidatus Yanofskybacteria bacterium GW2011_GWD1_39_16 TaxID=1619030 RepID=A0A837HZT3_9BACT|nr:MAG: hypothetical protein UT35_C0015G0009 [Candidatus Yanofskybacteria bacterium GW2011_GWD1_39_16]KKR14959.1 MAG: hypothetical protein UT43_C0011G0001 [Parcubacteria group bacterium GW2011_GWC1_39_29]HBT80445.1 hypothetical protein [Candidatus Yanofskybacteria bacterium]
MPANDQENSIENFTNAISEVKIERGDIVWQEQLGAGWPIRIVEIRGIGHIFFRSDDHSDRQGQEYNIRSNLEKLAYAINSWLGFNIVPATSHKELDGETGIAQRIVMNAVSANIVAGEWARDLDDLELLKAGVFDYLIDAKDRCLSSFLIDQSKNKVWLINNDAIMFNDGLNGSMILDKCRERQLTKRIPAGLISAVSEALTQAKKIIKEGKLSKDEQAILVTFSARAEQLIHDKQII